MSAIKRSESLSCKRGSGEKIKHESAGSSSSSKTAIVSSESATSAQQATSKLVFGLNARTNKVKHDEYAEQRLKASEASGPKTASAPKTRATSSSHNSQGESCKLNGHTQQGASLADNSQLEVSRKSKTAIRGLKNENSPKCQDPETASQQANSMREKRSDNLALPKSEEPTASGSGASAATAAPTTDDNHKTGTTGGLQLTQNKAAKEEKSLRARSRSPERQRRGSDHEKEEANRPKVARKKSVGERNASKEEVAGLKVERANGSSKNEQEQQVIVKARTQFNILPPPQLAMATTGRGSVVSYAKSRIYDKPSKPILSNPPSMVDQLSSIGATGGLPSSLVFSVGGEIPQSILCGRKPPRQVNVSKARKEWEGGEPFAKCRSRKRLAAAQRNKNKLLIHESWSMTSVVATQQLQLQQALAASSATHRSNVEQSDPSVKVLQRGSVLERVQQFERVPSSSSLSSASISSSSSASSLADSQFDSDYEEAELYINQSADPGDADGKPRPLRPDASKQAAYRYKVSSIQRQQSSGATLGQEQNGKLVATRSSAAAPLAYGYQQRDGGTPPQRRLSFRRRSSLASKSNLIPKFYHPQGTKPNTYEIELEKRNIIACFNNFPDRKAQLVGPNARRNFHSIALACGFSEYFKIPLLNYVKHMIVTRPELLDETNLDVTTSGLSSMRRRSSLVPLNPNNTQALRTSSAALSNSKTKHSLTRSNSSQQVLDKSSTIMPSNERKPAEATIYVKLKKSASIDSDDKQAENKNDNSRTTQHVSCEQFLAIWRLLIGEAYDNAARFTHLLTFGQRNFLLPDDFVPLVQSIIDDHPGLKFLRAALDFHMRYIQTVIARIYYCVNRSWTGKIKLQELRRSNLLAVLQVLSQEEDINQITDYFSYEHFYVIYCKFWNLDQDHDLLISKEDLARHNDASISSRIIERIFSGIVSKQIAMSGKMSYSDFVWFLIAEEDKKHPRSVEYWFRLMDLDGDGYISMYEMEYFYYEQMRRLELMNIEALPFIDTACQILDLVNPKEKNKISLADLKRTKMATIFFDTFINLEKYLEHESREFVSTRDVVLDGTIISDWDRYASEEYENMVTEESSV